MSSPRIIARPFKRVFTAILMALILFGAVILMPGVVGAALKTVHPAIPATGEDLKSYAAIGTDPLGYNGGLVITNPQVYLIFEDDPNDPFWTQPYQASENNIQRVEQYFSDVNGSTLEGLLTQYYDTDASGTKHYISNTISVAGAALDTGFKYSNECNSAKELYDSGSSASPNDMTDEIAKEISANQWTNTTSTIFFVFTPIDYSLTWGVCVPNSLQCGYHETIGSYNYAAMNYEGSNPPAGCDTDGNATDTMINEASHEQFEAISDPETSFYTVKATGWYNADCNAAYLVINTCEMGDMCGNVHPGIYLNSTLYSGVQGEFSNATGKCEYTVAPTQPTPTPTHTPVTTHTACSTSPSYSHCDGYDPPGSHCSASYGAYNVGRYPGDYTWLQIWYDSTCKSNYIIVNWPSTVPSCGPVACNAIMRVNIERTIPGYAGTWCNQSSTNSATCNDAASTECTAPGSCPSGTLLSFCAKLSANCDTAFGSTFNGEYIGTTSGWQSFYTDLLYAPNQAVRSCMQFFNTNYPYSFTDFYCSQWH